MGKNGIQSSSYANVPQDIDGVDSCVKNLIFVRTAEHGAQNINSVFAHKDFIGEGTAVNRTNNALVGNILIPLYQNVCVFLDLIGMEKAVSNVKMEEYGISQLYHAHAL